jgi:hypothetical protein
LLAAPAWAQFRIPNAADAFAADQAEVDSVDIDILQAGLYGYGVLTGCAVTAQASPDMTLIVASGTIKVGATFATVTSGNVTITTAHATLPRFDLVVVNSAGTKSVTAGTASSNPSFPAMPAGSVVLAAVYVPAADTTIEQNHVTDKRVILTTVLTSSLTQGGITNGQIVYGDLVGTTQFLTSNANLSFDDSTNVLTIIGNPLIAGDVRASGHFTSTGIGAGSGSMIAQEAALTPDGPILQTGTTANSWHLAEYGDAAFDFQNGPCASSACTDPNFIIHSHNQNTTQWLSLKHDGTNGVIDVGTGLITFNDSASIVGSLHVQSDNQIYSGTAGEAPYLMLRRSTLTPDSGIITTGSLANSVHIFESADNSAAYDFANGPAGTAAAINPQVIVHDKDQNTTDYASIGVSGISGGFRVTLTESATTAVVQVPVAVSAGTGGVLNYCVFASDATDQQQRCARVRFAVTNKAGTETCGMSNNAGTADASITELEDGNASAISAGTLTYAVTCSTTPTNAVNLEINAVSSLVQTTLQVRGSVLLVGPGEPLPQ